MCDDWMPVLRFQMSIEQFHQLPRHPAYKYEYLGDYALLTPRAKFYHARLVLSRFAPAADLHPTEPLEVRLIRDEDFPALKNLFAGTFAAHQPFASLDPATMQRAADRSLERTRMGQDGPWLRAASFLAHARTEPNPVAAIFVTLLPEGDPLEFDSYYWRDPAPADLVERRGGRPHLTWIFVQPRLAGQGAGTLLLGEAVDALTRLGYADLLSTFLVGNHASTLWHWRNGFELLTNPFSVRKMRREIRGK